MTETLIAWTDCPDCGDTACIPPFNRSPAIVLQGTLTRPAANIATCTTCGSTVFSATQDEE